MKIDGLLLLDKPSGITSNAALQKVKRLLGAEKAGHTGTLDPLASGLLPIALGQATKFSQFLLNADKTYQVTAHLGCVTDTGDAEGTVMLEREVPDNVAENIASVLSPFRGEISQRPPMYSALKYQGRPLYALARQGIEVERPLRQVVISELTMLAYRQPQLSLSVTCSKGTYIRSLVEDIGNAIGCGAHVVVLRRTDIAGLPSEHRVSLSQLQGEQASGKALNDYLLPVDTGLQHLPRVTCDSHMTKCLLQGQSVSFSEDYALGVVAIYGEQQAFLGVGCMLEAGKLSPKRLMV